MPTPLILSITALIALMPAAVLSYRAASRRDAVFWILLAVAIAGSLVVVWTLFGVGWRSGFSSALWLSVAVSLVLYAGLAAISREGWRLAPLLMPYLILFAVLATIWQNQPDPALGESAPDIWVQLHILMAVVSYGILTLGAVAGFSVFLQERALKRKQPTGLTRLLPSVADGEALQVRLLGASALLLALGLVTGMAVQYVETGAVLELAHKPVLAVGTFAVLIALLVAHWRTGIRGRRAARVFLLAYLLLTLAYPGVKWVTDVALA